MIGPLHPAFERALQRDRQLEIARVLAGCRKAAPRIRRRRRIRPDDE